MHGQPDTGRNITSITVIISATAEAALWRGVNGRPVDVKGLSAVRMKRRRDAAGVIVGETCVSERWRCGEERSTGRQHVTSSVTSVATYIQHVTSSVTSVATYSKQSKWPLYINEYRTPLSPRGPLIGSSRDFTREHGSSRAWKWSTSDVDCGFLIKVTRENSVTFYL